MQFILTQEEHDALTQKHEQRTTREIAMLQTLCTFVADTLPVKFWGHEKAKPWGCIITAEEKGHEHYCDECPCLAENIPGWKRQLRDDDVCPYEHKSFSK